jgi:S-phase kinase-associated protein 1
MNIVEIVSAPYTTVNWDTHIVLKSNDSVEYKISRNAIAMSGHIKEMISDHPADVLLVLPMEKVDALTLKYVIQYMEYHWNNRAEPIEKPLKQHISESISEWDKQFLYTDLVKNGDEKKHELLIHVTIAANFMNIPALLDLTTACISSIILDKTTEQIRSVFNIEKDFSPEREAKNKMEIEFLNE